MSPNVLDEQPLPRSGNAGWSGTGGVARARRSPCARSGERSAAPGRRRRDADRGHRARLRRELGARTCACVGRGGDQRRHRRRRPRGRRKTARPARRRRRPAAVRVLRPPRKEESRGARARQAGDASPKHGLAGAAAASVRLGCRITGPGAPPRRPRLRARRQNGGAVVAGRALPLGGTSGEEGRKGPLGSVPRAGAAAAGSGTASTAHARPRSATRSRPVAPSRTGTGPTPSTPTSAFASASARSGDRSGR